MQVCRANRPVPYSNTFSSARQLFWGAVFDPQDDTPAVVNGTVNSSYQNSGGATSARASPEHFVLHSYLGHRCVTRRCDAHAKTRLV